MQQPQSSSCTNSPRHTPLPPFPPIPYSSFPGLSASSHNATLFRFGRRIALPVLHPAVTTTTTTTITVPITTTTTTTTAVNLRIHHLAHQPRQELVRCLDIRGEAKRAEEDEFGLDERLPERVVLYEVSGVCVCAGANRLLLPLAQSVFAFAFECRMAYAGRRMSRSRRETLCSATSLPERLYTHLAVYRVAGPESLIQMANYW